MTEQPPVKKKVFITGVTGLLGRHIAAQCAEKGYEVVGLVRKGKGVGCTFPFKLKLLVGDITEFETLPADLAGADVVIHCAANTSMYGRFNATQEKENQLGLANMVKLAQGVRLSKFIHISSANTLAFGTKENPADESGKLQRHAGRLPYVNSKIWGEQFLTSAFKEKKFPVVILNPTLVFGPHDYHMGSSKLLNLAINKTVKWVPAGGKNIVDARDVAQAVVCAIEKGKTGENYLLSNENCTYKELFEKVLNLQGKPASLNLFPNSIIKIVGFVGSVYEFLTSKTFGLNRKTVKLSLENHYYNNEKASRELLFAPRHVDETIRDTVNWLIIENNANRKS